MKTENKTPGQTAFEAFDPQIKWSVLGEYYESRWQKAAQAVLDAHAPKLPEVTAEDVQNVVGRAIVNAVDADYMARQFNAILRSKGGSTPQPEPLAVVEEWEEFEKHTTLVQVGDQEWWGIDWDVEIAKDKIGLPNKSKLRRRKPAVEKQGETPMNDNELAASQTIEVLDAEIDVERKINGDLRAKLTAANAEVERLKKEREGREQYFKQVVARNDELHERLLRATNGWISVNETPADLNTWCLVGCKGRDPFYTEFKGRGSDRTHWMSIPPLPDAPQPAEKKDAWKAYRETLALPSWEIQNEAAIKAAFLAGQKEGGA